MAENLRRQRLSSIGRLEDLGADKNVDIAVGDLTSLAADPRLRRTRTSGHAATTMLTQSYHGGRQMASGFGSEISSRAASRISGSEFSSRAPSEFGIGAVSKGGYGLGGLSSGLAGADLGLTQVLSDRRIHGYLSSSTVSLNKGSSSMVSLTPSVISSPNAPKRSFSPTGTPLNSPTHTPPGKRRLRGS